MKTLLWLDDIRDPYENGGAWAKTFSPIELSMGDLHTEVVWVKNYDEFTSWINSNGLPDGICFDHDLSDFQAFYHGYPEHFEDWDDNVNEIVTGKPFELIQLVNSS